MAFLKKLLRKKPGGTAVGNIFRGASANLSGGALGQGMNKIEIGQTQTNRELAQNAGSYQDPFTLAINNALTGAAMTREAQGGAWATIGIWAKEKWYIVLGLIGAIAGSIWYFTKGKKSGKKKIF